VTRLACTTAGAFASRAPKTPKGSSSSFWYAYHPSRHLPPAKVRAFLDFVVSLFQS